MNIEKIFFLLRENDKITKEQLYECGADDKYIEDSIEYQILTPIGDDTYSVGNVEELVYYGRYLNDMKKYKAANSVFNCAYVNGYDNFIVNYQLFLNSLELKKRSHIFKHFDFVCNKFIEDGKEYDANYYLFILGSLYDLDDKYKDKFINLEVKDILIPGDDAITKNENMLRRNIFANSYFNASTMVDQRYTGISKKDMQFEDVVERELLIQWLIRKRNFNKSLVACFEANNMEEAKRILDIEDERRSLTITNQYILKIVNSYLTLHNTGIVPISKYNGDNIFDAINGNNYALALELEEKRIKEHGIDRETTLHMALMKFVSLIGPIKEDKNTKVDKVVVPKPVKEVKPIDFSLTEKEMQKLDSKLDKLYNGRMIFLLDPMPGEKRDLVREYIKNNGYDDVFAISIGIEPERRLVLRYKPKISEYVDLKSVLDDAKAFYASEDYELAADCYELALKIGRPRESTYGGYGMTLYRLGRVKEALDCLKVATIMSKTEGNGKIDFTDIILRIENPPERENRKPRVVVNESEFEDSHEDNDTIVNDIVALYSEGEIDLMEACKTLNLSEDDTNYIKLLYARDCYYLGDDAKGDKFFKQVEKCKDKSKRVKDLYKDIMVNKKYYHNRLDSDKKQLVIIKK